MHLLYDSLFSFAVPFELIPSHLFLIYYIYFIFSILLLEALITEEPSGEHKFSGGWLLFLFIFSHIHIKDYYNLLLKRIQKIRDHLFLT